MARQRIHNQRAGRGGGGGVSWISYSDMMAALLLVFVLILCVSLNQYFTMMSAKEAELDEQRSLVALQSTQLAAQQITLGTQAAQIAAQQTQLSQQTLQLSLQAQQLEEQTQQVQALQISLDAQALALQQQQTEMESLQAAYALQAAQLDELVGVRTRIISSLSSGLKAAGLAATVDPTNGDIVLDSTVFFDTNSSTIKLEGQDLLNRFVPVYLSVLLSPEYSGYLGQIIVEGHTDTSGGYFTNLELSQKRALAVAEYVLKMPSLTNAQRQLLQNILTATGRSYSNPIYAADGSVDMDASRRVEFHFSLKDAEMIAAMSRLLTQGSTAGGSN